MKETKRPYYFYVLWFISIAALPNVAIDCLTPVIPALADFFDTTTAQIQQAIGTQIGLLSGAVLVFGCVSMFSRRRPLILYGALAAAIGYGILPHTSNLRYFVILLSCCGMGLASCSLFRALQHDVFSGPQLRKIAADVNLYLTLIYAIGPFVSGILLVNYGWQGIMYFLMMCCITCCFITLIAPEPHRKDHNKVQFDHLASAVSAVCQPASLASNVCNAMTMLNYIALLLTIPILVIGQLGWRPDAYGGVFLLIAGTSQMLGAMANRALITHYSEGVILHAVWLTLAGNAGLLSLCNWAMGLQVGWIFVLMWVNLFATVMIWPNIMTSSFAKLTKHAGVAASLFAFFQYVGAFAGAWICSYFPRHSIDGLALTLFLSNIISLVIFNKLNSYPSTQINTD